MEQQSIFPADSEEFKEAKEAYSKLRADNTSRVRYSVPTYEKFYTLYQYDRMRFRTLLNAWLKTEEGKKRTLETLREKQRELLEICYIRDKNGQKQRDNDEAYILSTGRLQKIHEELYNILLARGVTNLRGWGLVCYNEDRQIEIYNSWCLPLKNRLLKHLRLLYLLKSGDLVGPVKALKNGTCFVIKGV